MRIRSSDTPESNLFITGHTIVLAGTLQNMTHAEAKRILKALGAKIRRQVTSRTDMVVAGSRPGNKLNRAKALGVSILAEYEFLQELNDRRFTQLPMTL